MLVFSTVIFIHCPHGVWTTCFRPAVLWGEDNKGPGRDQDAQLAWQEIPTWNQLLLAYYCGAWYGGDSHSQHADILFSKLFYTATDPLTSSLCFCLGTRSSMWSLISSSWRLTATVGLTMWRSLTVERKMIHAWLEDTVAIRSHSKWQISLKLFVGF